MLQAHHHYLAPSMLTCFGGDYLTPPEIAKLLGVKTDTVREWIRRGDLAAYNFARKGKRPMYRVSPDQWQAYLSRCEVKPPPMSQRRKRLEPEDGVIQFYDLSGKPTHART